MKITRIISIAVLSFVLLFPALVLASSSDTNVYFGKNEKVAGNYYAAGSSVEIEGKVGGDLFAVGGNVVVTGEIAGDVLVLGGNIRISGSVGGNVRVVGGNVELTGPVNKNVSVASGNLNISSTSNISGSVSLACGTFSLRGAVAGSVDGYVGNTVIAGTIKGNTNLILGPQNSLQIQDSALVQSKFTYKATKSAQVSAGAKLSEPLNYLAYTATSSGQYNSDWWSKQLVAIFSLLVIALVITSLFPNFLQQVSQNSQIKPWRHMLWGFVWFIVPLPVVVLLAVTLIGLPLGLMLLALYIIGIYIIPIFAGATLSVYLKTLPSLSFMNRWPLLLSVCVGIVIFKLLTFLPFIGWLMALVVMLWLWGAMISTLKQYLGSK